MSTGETDPLQAFVDQVMAARSLSNDPAVVAAIGQQALTEFHYFVAALRTRFPDRMPGGQPDLLRSSLADDGGERS